MSLNHFSPISSSAGERSAWLGKALRVKESSRGEWAGARGGMALEHQTCLGMSVVWHVGNPLLL